jgi:hypothetical protein
MYLYVSVHVSVYIYNRMHIHFVYVYVFMYVCMSIYLYIYMYVHIYTCIPGPPETKSQFVVFSRQEARYIRVSSLLKYKGGGGFSEVDVVKMYTYQSAW